MTLARYWGTQEEEEPGTTRWEGDQRCNKRSVIWCQKVEGEFLCYLYVLNEVEDAHGVGCVGNQIQRRLQL